MNNFSFTVKLKWVYPLIISFLLLTSCKKHLTVDSKTDRERWNLKENVKSVLETKYTESGKYKTVIHFNEEGLVTEQAAYNPDESLIRKWNFKYNNGLKEKLYCYVGADSLSYILTYHYDKKDNIVSIEFIEPTGISSTQALMAYNTKNQKIKETFFDVAGNVEHEILFKYTNDLPIEEMYYDAVLKKKWKQINSYDHSGNKTQVVFLSMVDSVLNKKVLRYGDDGKVKETSLSDSKDSLITHVTYNRAGEEEERINFLPNGKEYQRLDYNFDEEGNWTLMKANINNKSRDFVTREIQYY